MYLYIYIHIIIIFICTYCLFVPIVPLWCLLCPTRGSANETGANAGGASIVFAWKHFLYNHQVMSGQSAN